MDIRLSQKQTQKQILAPQLRQFLRLLELPIFELNQKIDQELVQNPVLEENSTREAGMPLESLHSEPTDGRGASDDSENVQAWLDAGRYGKNYLKKHVSYDFSREPVSDSQKKRDYRESILTKKKSLYDRLEEQLSILDLNKHETRIAHEIIGNINDEGRLLSTLAEIAAHTHTDVPTVERTLRKIQSLEPPGIAARNLQECLLLQLERKPFNTALAKKLVSEFMPQLERHQFDQISKSLSIAVEKIKSAYLQIQKLQPKPGFTFSDDPETFIVPDAQVFPDPENEDEFQIEITHEPIPELRINPMYRQMLRNQDTDPETKKYLRERIQAGLDLIRALAQRKSTIRLITEEILKEQKEFFLKGFAHLKPLRLKDVASRLNVHESTVSRAIQGKFISTPQGTIPYKSFFSARLDTEDGDLESQKSVMERLKLFVSQEDKKRPLSDAKLAAMFQKEGVKISRRTIAKYRERLKILPTYLRKNR